ncbi:MAG: 2Fe-2S iron-sulfur cluster binding domain-containing protein [Cyanobacteria bacterium P01_D01_bin.73]
MGITVRFLPDNREAIAEPGEPLLNVADRAGVMIPTGCMMGSCHACEVDLIDQEGEEETVCACIAAVPSGPDPLEVNLAVDPSW